MHRSLGPGEEWTSFLYPIAGDERAASPGSHVALRAADRRSVQRFYAVALEAGASAVPDRHPAERPPFGADYFGGGVKDPDGHVIEVLTRAPA